MLQSGFFDLTERLSKLDERDKLLQLDEIIDWEKFRPVLSQCLYKPRKSNAGRKAKDSVMMFKGLVLQHLYNLSDEELEFQIRDRYTFCRFLGLSPEEAIPDANTFWDFREALSEKDAVKVLFEHFGQQLEAQGYKARKGQMVDASFVDVPRQRNSREENQQIKAGEIPDSFKEKPHKRQQKDTDARWTKKNQETHYGYKDHVSADNAHKLIRDYEVTSSSVHDSQVFKEILADNTAKDIWADSAYRSEDHEQELKKSGYRSHVHKKGTRGRPLSEREQHANKKKSKVRVRVEHIFGSITNEQKGLFVRTIGLVRAKMKIGMMNLVYNMRRFVFLRRRGLSTL